MQFTVPQFIEVEPKVLGPITVRQFLVMLVTVGFLFVFYKLFDFTLFLILGIPTFIFAILIAFAKINGQNFHFFLLNMFITFKKPKIRIWKKIAPMKQVELKKKTKDKPSVAPQKKPILVQGAKLSELSLLVNTGGAYKPKVEEKK